MSNIGRGPGHPQRIELSQLATLIPNGSTIAFGGCIGANRPIGAVRQMIRQSVKDLVVYSTLGGVEVELLIRAGLVKRLYLSHVSLGVFGVAPFFRRAVASQVIETIDISGNLLLAALDGGARRVPFLPMQGDPNAPYLTESPGIAALATCPFTSEEVLVVKSIRPDIVIIHAAEVDEEGNALLATNIFADRVLAMAGKTVIVTYERDSSGLARGGDRHLPRIFIDAVCQAPKGAFPTSFSPEYDTSIDWFENYLSEPSIDPISEIRSSEEAAYLHHLGVL